MADTFVIFCVRVALLYHVVLRRTLVLPRS
jgi:hypothetical protein